MKKELALKKIKLKHLNGIKKQQKMEIVMHKTNLVIFMKMELVLTDQLKKL